MKLYTVFTTICFLFVSIHSQQIDTSDPIVADEEKENYDGKDNRHHHNGSYHNSVSSLDDSLWMANKTNHRHLDIQVNNCDDATEWFTTRPSYGVNIFKTYYTCECSGDFTSYFTLSCRLTNYCFTIDNNVTEECINRNSTFEFSVDPILGIIDKYQRGRSCIEYLTNGSTNTGPICQVSPDPCSYLMHDDHGYNTEMAIQICTSSTCQVLLPTLGYTMNEVADLCPTATYNGLECNSNGWQSCDESTDKVVHRYTPDCSNVEPCATEACQEYLIYSATPERVFVRYPQCNASRTAPPTPSITMSPSVSRTAPPITSITMSPSVSRSAPLNASCETPLILLSALVLVFL